MTARTLPRSPPREGSQPSYDRIPPAPCEVRDSSSHQPLGQSTGLPRQISQAATIEACGGENALLSREDWRSLLPEDSRASNYETNPADADEGADSPAVTLHRSVYIVLIVLIYASLALTAWILICVLTFKPLTTSHYGFDTRVTRGHLQAKYIKSEEIYRAARTVQAVVGVLTIPLTSAVCSAAAVVFAQSKQREQRLTMRQMMALADKSWTDPTTIAKLFIGRGKQISSSLLIFSLLLNLFGECLC